MNILDFIPKISIHALRGEGDSERGTTRLYRRDFNPRPPWGGRPLRRARRIKRYFYFNPRPPWGGRHMTGYIRSDWRIFQSTPSVGRATFLRLLFLLLVAVISIHALRGEGDLFFSSPRISNRISIHALRGEGDDIFGFWRAAKHISIHALRGEGDAVSLRPCAAIRSNFNPRPPWGGRRSLTTKSRKRRNISIHALRGEGDDTVRIIGKTYATFQSTPSVGRATLIYQM